MEGSEVKGMDILPPCLGLYGTPSLPNHVRCLIYELVTVKGNKMGKGVQVRTRTNVSWEEGPLRGRSKVVVQIPGDPSRHCRTRPSTTGPSFLGTSTVPEDCSRSGLSE